MKIKETQVYGFEPDPEVFSLLKRNLIKFKNISLLELAVGESDRLVGFLPSKINLSSRGCGVVEDNSNYKIKMISLDKFFENSAYSFLKIDPGGNIIFDILNGAHASINKFKPKIIAGAYHEIENLYKIPYKLMKINRKYKVYLRHLAFHANETHAFAII